MGATNCPETPRQKMITMMYLVYTAMLALNVSAEVVSGFKTVGNAMTKSNENLQVKLDDTYANFEQAMKNSPDKVQDKYNKALEVKKLSNELGDYIDSVTYTFVGLLESKAKIYADPENPKKLTAEINFGNPANLDSVKRAMQLGGFSWIDKLDNNHKGTKFFLGSAEGDHPTTGEIPKLIDKIHEYKHRVNELLGEDSTHVALGLDVDRYEVSSDKKTKSWEQLNFNNTVAGAALVTLTRLKAETMNAEFDVVNRLYKQVSMGDFTFDKVDIISRPKSTYIIQGGTFETRFNVAAYDSRQSFKATIAGREYESADSGAIKYSVACNTLGQQTVRGTAVVKNPEGGDQVIEFSENYFVAAPVGVVSLDNMQVLYSGIDNPITVGVPGVDGRNVKPTIIEGRASIRPGEGEGKYYIVPEVGVKTVTLAVDAILDKGKGAQRMNTLKFKVREIPTPEIIVGGNRTGATVSKKDLATTNSIKAVKNEGFVFDVGKGSSAYQVKKVEVAIGPREYPSEGSAMSPDAISAIRKADRGTQVFVTAHVRMPDGTTKQATCTLKLK